MAVHHILHEWNERWREEQDILSICIGLIGFVVVVANLSVSVVIIKWERKKRFQIMCKERGGETETKRERERERPKRMRIEDCFPVLFSTFGLALSFSDEQALSYAYQSVSNLCNKYLFLFNCNVHSDSCCAIPLEALVMESVQHYQLLHYSHCLHDLAAHAH